MKGAGSFDGVAIGVLCLHHNLKHFVAIGPVFVNSAGSSAKLQMFDGGFGMMKRRQKRKPPEGPILRGQRGGCGPTVVEFHIGILQGALVLAHIRFEDVALELLLLTPKKENGHPKDQSLGDDRTNDRTNGPHQRVKGIRGVFSLKNGREEVFPKHGL